MLNERSDIQFPLWRKKVDRNLLERNNTPIPSFLWDQWKINCSSTHSEGIGTVQLFYGSKEYYGRIHSKPKRGKKYQCFLSFDSELGDALKETYIMSYMRCIEEQLRKPKEEYEGTKIEEEIPFWEFLDLEFDIEKRQFYLTSHYIQKPIFIQLFKEIIDSQLLASIQSELTDESQYRISKEKWKTRSLLQGQLDVPNAIYYLFDENNKELYIGETKSLKRRLTGERSEIPNWTHYRYDSLPYGISKEQRVALERMIIRAFASFIHNKRNIDTVGVSEYSLVNKKIDA